MKIITILCLITVSALLWADFDRKQTSTLLAEGLKFEQNERFFRNDFFVVNGLRKDLFEKQNNC